MTTPSDYTSAKHAAAYYGVTTQTLRRWAKAGKINSFKTPSGQSRYQMAGKPKEPAPLLDYIKTTGGKSGSMNGPTVAGIKITDETMELTRRHFADICQDCIDEAESGKVHVNNLRAYVDDQRSSISGYLSGKIDNSVTFLQRAHSIQTGLNIPLLSPEPPKPAVPAPVVAKPAKPRKAKAVPVEVIVAPKMDPATLSRSIDALTAP